MYKSKRHWLTLSLCHCITVFGMADNGNDKTLYYTFFKNSMALIQELQKSCNLFLIVLSLILVRSRKVLEMLLKVVLEFHNSPVMRCRSIIWQEDEASLHHSLLV